jgi:mannitol/fructose-specific phosphotransferase system IIA component (Ntr-type)
MSPVARRSADEEAFERLSHVKPSGFGAGLSLTFKSAVFHHASEAFAQVAPERSVAEIEAALWARERTQNTSVGMEVALPHATIASMDRTAMGIVVSTQPVATRHGMNSPWTCSS